MISHELDECEINSERHECGIFDLKYHKCGILVPAHRKHNYLNYLTVDNMFSATGLFKSMTPSPEVIKIGDVQLTRIAIHADA